LTFLLVLIHNVQPYQQESAMMMRSIFSRIVLVTIVVFVVSGCSNYSSPSGPSYGSPAPSPSPSPSPQSNTVTISGFAFSPASLTVAVNATVTWTNNDASAHTATSDGSTWDTGSIAQGGSKSVTFSTAGTFPYHCSSHPSMHGTIVVQ
jgi:plastocyanin